MVRKLRLSPALRADLPLLYQGWRATKNPRKAPKKIRRARARWLDRLARTMDRERRRVETVNALVREVLALAARSGQPERVHAPGATP